jgi:hypothetical protein
MLACARPGLPARISATVSTWTPGPKRGC